MEILGYIGYAVLLVLGVTWTLGVRAKLDASASTVLGALFFVVGAIVLGVSGADKFHSLWIIAGGFLFAVLMAYVGARIPLLFGPFRLLSFVFSSVVRVGIPAHRIRAAQEAGLKASVEEWASKADGRNE